MSNIRLSKWVKLTLLQAWGLTMWEWGGVGWWSDGADAEGLSVKYFVWPLSDELTGLHCYPPPVWLSNYQDWKYLWCCWDWVCCLCVASRSWPQYPGGWADPIVALWPAARLVCDQLARPCRHSVQAGRLHQSDRALQAWGPLPCPLPGKVWPECAKIHIPAPGGAKSVDKVANYT